MPSDADLALARALHARGRVTEGALRELLALATPERPLGWHLVQRGLARPDEVGDAPAVDAPTLPPPSRDPSIATAAAPASAVGVPEGDPSAATLPPPSAPLADGAATLRPLGLQGMGGVPIGQPSTGAWRPGWVVDRYRVVEVIGQGGMGVVLRVEETSTGARYAMKTLISSDGSMLERFRREGQAQAQVDAHPNVVRIRSSGEAAGRLYLVMDLCTGGDLEGRLRQGPLEPVEAGRIVAALARGLAHVHRKGIIHRDLKPSNVLFDGPEATPKLVDFGVARLEGAERLTLSGSFVGTPAYASPEQAAGEKVDLRSDIYGMGAVLYHALTGHRPFSGDSPAATIKAVLVDKLRPPRSLRPEIPAALEEVVLTAMSREPLSRYPDGDALALAIEEALAAPKPGQRPARAVAVVVGALALGVTGAWWMTRTDRPAAPAPVAVEVAPVASRPAVASPPPAAEPARVYWKLEPGRTVSYRINWTEHNNMNTTVELGLDLVLECVAPPASSPEVTAFVARLTASHYVFNELRRVDEFLGPGMAARFTVEVDPRAGRVQVRGLSEIGAGVHAALEPSEKLGGLEHDSPGAVCLGSVVQAALTDEAFSGLLTATLGAGPSSRATGAPWLSRSAERARATEARVVAPLVPSLCTDYLPEGEPFEVTGEATYALGALKRASVRQDGPPARLVKRSNRGVTPGILWAEVDVRRIDDR